MAWSLSEEIAGELQPFVVKRQLLGAGGGDRSVARALRDALLARRTVVVLGLPPYDPRLHRAQRFGAGQPRGHDQPLSGQLHAEHDLHGHVVGVTRRHAATCQVAADLPPPGPSKSRRPRPRTLTARRRLVLGRGGEPRRAAAFARRSRDPRQRSRRARPRGARLRVRLAA